MCRLSAICPNVTPRQLVDDTSLRWSGAEAQCAEEVAFAADEAQEALTDLRLPVQVKKLGFVASDAATERTVQRVTQQRHIARQRWIRNLGHELTTVRPLRLQEQARMHAL
eukprot:6872833-Pyramimonas_sp.AAC.1